MHHKRIDDNIVKNIKVILKELLRITSKFIQKEDKYQEPTNIKFGGPKGNL